MLGTTGIAEYQAGLSLWSQGLREEAVERFERALSADPSIASSPYLEGLDRARAGDIAGAEGWLWLARMFQPEHVPTLRCLGDVLRRLGRLDEALPLLTEAVEREPRSWEAHSDLSLALWELDLFDRASASALRAVELHGWDARLCANLAIIRKCQGRFDEALALLDQAIRAAPAFQAAHVNRAHLLLQLGRFDEGWQAYEWRPTKKLTGPELGRGRVLAGKRVLLHQEQGLGDLIQFSRYCAVLEKAGARVTLSCEETMIPLMLRTRGVTAAVPWTGPAPDFDFEGNLLSLPSILRVGADAMGAAVPYLTPDPALVAAWRERLAGEQRLRVGVVWGGNPANPNHRRRSISLHQLAPVLRNPRVAFYSLQRGPQSKDLEHVPENVRLVDLGSQCEAVMDTAAVMMNLDLIISADTMPAHLAGALGRPVWLLLHSVPDWRWMMERDDSPWYPSTRLFRQTSPGDWTGVTGRLAAALDGFFTVTHR